MTNEVAQMKSFLLIKLYNCCFVFYNKICLQTEVGLKC